MLSIVIPIYNEKLRINQTIGGLDRFSKKCDQISEIIFVDDGSTDGTIKIIEKLIREIPYLQKKIVLIQHKKNEGKGSAVRSGMQASLKGGAGFILFTDADLSTPLEESLRLIAERGNSEIIIGSRSMESSTLISLPPLSRRITSKIFTLIRRTILINTIHDSQCGFKIFSRHAAEKIIPLQKINGFAFDIEILKIAQIQKISIKETGVIWNYNNQGNLKILPTSLEIFYGLIKIRLNIFFGIYK